MKVLFVDDDALNRRLVREMLQIVGAEMDEAAGGAEGVSKVESRHYDAVLMDLRMPEMDGLTAIRKIRALPNRGELPILVVTADTAGDLKARCTAAGANGLLFKPVAMRDLVEALGPLLAKAGQITF